MKGDISTVAGVLVIIAVSLIFGFMLLRQSDLITDTVEYSPQSISEIKSLQNTLREGEPTPYATSSPKR